MLHIHPKLLEELSELFDDYMELGYKDKQLVRASLAEPYILQVGYWKTPHILGGTQQPQSNEVKAFSELVDEYQITYAIKARYTDKEINEPRVSYWIRAGP